MTPIEKALEAEQRALYERMREPDYFRQPPDVLRADRARTDEIERLLMEKLERWEALEAKAAQRA
jgi:ABC transport system ATP-binding/permease protein